MFSPPKKELLDLLDCKMGGKHEMEMKKNGRGSVTKNELAINVQPSLKLVETNASNERHGVLVPAILTLPLRPLRSQILSADGLSILRAQQFTPPKLAFVPVNSLRIPLINRLELLRRRPHTLQTLARVLPALLAIVADLCACLPGARMAEAGVNVS